MSTLREQLDHVVTVKLYERGPKDRENPTVERIFEILRRSEKTPEQTVQAVQQAVVYFIGSLNIKKLAQFNVSVKDLESLMWAVAHAFPVDFTSDRYLMFLPLVSMFKSNIKTDSTGANIQDKLIDEFADIIIDEITTWATIHRYASELSKTPDLFFSKDCTKHIGLLELSLDIAKVYAYKTMQIENLVPILERRCKKIAFKYIEEDSTRTLCAKIEKSKVSLSKMIDLAILRIEKNLEDDAWDPYTSKDVHFLKGVLARWRGYDAVCYNLGPEHYFEILDAYRKNNTELVNEKITQHNSYRRTLKYVHMPLSECTSQERIYRDGDPHGRQLFTQLEQLNQAHQQWDPIDPVQNLESAAYISRFQIVFNLFASAMLGLCSIFFMFASSIFTLDTFPNITVHLHEFAKWSVQDTLIVLGWKLLCFTTFIMYLYVLHKQIERWYGILGKKAPSVVKTLFLLLTATASLVCGYFVCFFIPDVSTSASAIIVLDTVATIFKVLNLIDMIDRISMLSTKEVVVSMWPSITACILTVFIVFFMKSAKNIAECIVVR